MKPFTTLAIALFALIAVLQLVRFLQGWPITINGMELPVWASGIMCLVAAGLAIMLWRENRRMAA